MNKLVQRAAQVLGAVWFLLLNIALTGAWLVAGYWFEWSDTWQLSYTTALTVTTWWAAILIQGSQSNDTAALHAKMDELIRANAEADDALRGIEKEER